MKELVERLKKTEHGFKHIVEAGDVLLSNTLKDCFAIAETLLGEESYQARMLATYLLGKLSVSNNNAFLLLKTKVADDGNWRVQEMLAKAIDDYCKTKGYEASLPVIKEWLSSDKVNLKRAVIEGLRIWTSRPYFKENPEVAIALICRNKNTKEKYLLKSVGNALRDISRKYPDLIQKETSSWDLTDSYMAFVYKLVNKNR